MTDKELEALRAQIEAESLEPLPELDARFEALAADALSADERDTLQAERTTSAVADAAWDALQPLGPDAEARFADRAASWYRRPVERTAPRQPWWGWAAGLGTLIAAAVAVGVLRTPEAPLGVTYEAQWRSGEQGVRAEPTAPETTPRFAPGSTIRLDLRPASAVDQQPTAIVALDAWDQRLDVPLTVTEGGVVRLVATLGEAPWTLEPGVYTLLVAVGPAPAPAVDDVAPAAWQTFRLPFQVDP